jgi:hypothetical protein|tara:strand:+ start:66 stop:485 length:420 start_codon:yes stop_codon:yes gene_type:complete
MTNKKDVTANTKTAKTRKPIAEESVSGALNPNLRIVLGDNFVDSGCYDSLPKQVRIALRMVWNEFDGSCTVGELDKAWDSSEYSDVNGGKYVQGIIAKAGQKSFFTHYFTATGTATKNLVTRKNAMTEEQYKEHICIIK